MPQRTRAQRLNGLFPLSYTGVIPVSPVNFVIDDRPPTINDSKNFYIGDLWLDKSTEPPAVDNLWMLVSLAGHNATWVNFGAGDLETLTGNTGGPVGPDGAGNINVIGDGTTINIAGNPGTNTLTVSVVGTGVLSTLTGNSGGPVPPTAGNINIITANATPTFVGNPGTSTITQDFNLSNLVLGSSLPAVTVLAARNVGMGSAALASLTDGTDNVAIGDHAGRTLSISSSSTLVGSQAGFSLTTGQSNTAIGSNALRNATAGAGNNGVNVAVGSQSLFNLTTGSHNTSIGSQAAAFLTTGTYNTFLGYANSQPSGNLYLGAESSNVLLANAGVVGESNTMRFGNTGAGNGQQNRAFMAGVRGVTTGIADAIPVVIDSAGQLGTAGITPVSPSQFAAYKSVDTPNATGDGTFYQPIFDVELYDLGSNYNTGTGTFTAPTSGVYHFDVYVACNNITTQNLSSLFIVTTTKTYESNLQSPVNDKTADNILHYQLSIDTNMSAGDTCFIQISLSGAAKTVGITGAIPPGSPIATYFNGHRIDSANTLVLNPTTYQADIGSAQPAAGILGIVGADNITTSGSGNTITIDYTPSSSFTAAFPVAANITGDGTIALLGATVAATVFSNVGGNFNPGNGAGTPASFTCPATGLYYFSFFANYSVTASGTAGVDFSLGLAGALGINFGILPTSNSCAGFANNSGNINTGGSSLTLLTLGDVVTFSVQSNGTAKNVTVGGTVSGYRIS